MLFHFDPGRGHEVALDLLKGFVGKLQSDAYVVYQTLARKVRDLVLFGCWTHARRKFHEAMASGNDPEAGWYVAEIQKLYRVERKAREGKLDAEARGRLRRKESAPALKRIKERLERDAASADVLSSSALGKAVAYAGERWPLLERYATEGNGEVDIDNNSVESERLAGAEMDCRRQPRRGPDAVGRHPDQNAIRPSAVGKKNCLRSATAMRVPASSSGGSFMDAAIAARHWLFIGHPKAGLLPRQWKQAREHAAEAERAAAQGQAAAKAA